MASAYRGDRHAEQVREWCRAALARWTEPHESHDVDTSLGPTHVVSLGHGDGVCIYLPGQPGLSCPVRPKDEVPAYASWLAELVSWVRSRRDQGPLVIAGHSRGAAVALSADPDAVDGLALLSPAGLVGTTGAPGAYPERVVARWKGRNLRVVVGEHDAFFPAARLREASRSRLGKDPVVLRGAGHLLVDEEPERVTELVAELCRTG